MSIRTIKRGYPQTYSGQEESTLKDLNPDFETPSDLDSARQLQTAQSIENKEDPYNGIEDQLYGSIAGKGYLRPPNATGRGYLTPPQGGWLQIPLMLAASILPGLFGSGFEGAEHNQLTSNNERGGHHRRSAIQYVYPSKPFNTSSASSFYRDLAGQALGQGMPEEILHEKMSQLFGNRSLYKQMLNGKVGSGIQDQLKMGHLLSAPLISHLKKALKGTKIDPYQVMDMVEKTMPEVMEQPITPEIMARGGSILGSIWNGIKSIFGKVAPAIGKVISNPTVRNIASKTLETAGKVAEKQAPKLAEIAANKLAQYAKKKLTGDEPSGKKKGKKVVEEVEEETEEAPAEVEEEVEEPPPVNRKTKRKVVETEPELPSASGDIPRRKAAVAQKKSKALVPYVAPSEEKAIIGFRNGTPLYASGLGRKKKAYGGAWTLKLQRE